MVSMLCQVGGAAIVGRRMGRSSTTVYSVWYAENVVTRAAKH